ncbi:hypothetical protein Glove_104g38 [Diversispora epigaea]|uniref:Uncharacterized protein n=1 Tax=Diversispora epigaea TaxID=1348612 RepID=A0A397J6Q4_9GLOM|nr:hypothetical protein Glove_104g38 [Diversispora epigaea]
MSRLNSIHLYRHTLRYLRSPDLPFPYLSPKLCYNARDLFEIHRYERNQAKIKKLIEDGWQDLGFIKAWRFLEKDLLDQIFRGFGNSGNDAKVNFSKNNEK